MNIRYTTFLFLAICLGLFSCRKEYRATEIDLANYGWTLFDDGNYTESNQWFIESVLEDSTYKDGYNGIGWSFGKMRDLDSSILYFERGLPYVQDENIVANVKKEIIAGLCFVYNAQGEDSLAITWGDSLKLNWNENTIWSFSHDTTITHMDIYITMASSYFGIGDFVNSLEQMQLILNIFTPGAGNNFVPNINTVAGRVELAGMIEDYQVVLNQP